MPCDFMLSSQTYKYSVQFLLYAITSHKWDLGHLDIYTKVALRNQWIKNRTKDTNESRKPESETIILKGGLFNLSTADILYWIIIWGGGAVTVIVGSVAIFLASTHQTPIISLLQTVTTILFPVTSKWGEGEITSF